MSITKKDNPRKETRARLRHVFTLNMTQLKLEMTLPIAMQRFSYSQKPCQLTCAVFLWLIKLNRAAHRQGAAPDVPTGGQRPSLQTRRTPSLEVICLSLTLTRLCSQRVWAWRLYDSSLLHLTSRIRWTADRWEWAGLYSGPENTLQGTPSKPGFS